MTARLQVGFSAFVLPGHSESGDHWVTKDFGDATLLAVVDGCGHGSEAALAAKRAVAVIQRGTAKGLIPLLTRCHAELKGTRGVVMSLAWFNIPESTLTWIGVGDVEGVLFRNQSLPSEERETLLLRGGVVGYHLPRLEASLVPVFPGDTLVFATDGIHPDFAAGVSSRNGVQTLADEISSRYCKGTDDSLVVVARYLG